MAATERPDPADYPRMMYHRTLGYIIVANRQEETDLGPEWSRQIYVEDPDKDAEEDEEDEKAADEPQEEKKDPAPPPRKRSRQASRT